MRSHLHVIALTLLASSALTACADRGPGGRPGGAPPGGAPMAQSMLFSPNGEPLNGGPLGAPSCPMAMNYWFDRADANHDGRLDRNEFLADARAQFARMDKLGLGYVSAATLEDYRAPFRSAEQLSNAADPVMAADVNLDFKVTQEEFLALANREFDRLASHPAEMIEKSALDRVCADWEKQTASRQGRGSPPNGGPNGGPPGGGHGGPGGGGR